ncbi:MAG: hypothetical protein MI924_28040 [Chloroflexales bacterium]|nr:hypothetical protein [Chloroflexales bacterium]
MGHAFSGLGGPSAPELEAPCRQARLGADKRRGTAWGPGGRQSDRTAGRIAAKRRKRAPDATGRPSGYHGWGLGLRTAHDRHRRSLPDDAPDRNGRGIST